MWITGDEVCPKSGEKPISVFVILGLDPRIHAANSAEECNRAEFWIAATP
jgi:hypothetical protein